MGINKTEISHIDVEITFTADGKGETYEFSLGSTALPQRVPDAKLRHSDLALVQVARKNGAGGVVKGIHNWKQIKGAVGYFPDDLVGHVDTIVKDLAKHGACAAFVLVQPTVAVPIPVFVLDDLQFKKVASLRQNNPRISLVPSYSTPLDHPLRKDYECLALIDTNDDVCTNETSSIKKTFSITVSKFSGTGDEKVVFDKDTILPTDYDAIQLECNNAETLRAELDSHELKNPEKVDGVVLFFDGRDKPSIHMVAEEAAKHGAIALLVLVDPEKSFNLPVFVFSEKELRALQSVTSFVSISKAPVDQDKELSSKETYADILQGGVPRPSASARESKSDSSGNSYFKWIRKVSEGVKSLMIEPKVRSDLKSILQRDCDWMPSAGKLDSFQTAMTLLTIYGENSTEINEIFKQICEHMKESNYQVDVVLFSFFLSVHPKLEKKEQNQLRRFIEKCFDNFRVTSGTPKLSQMTIGAHDKSTLATVRQLLCEFTSNFLQRSRSGHLKEANDTVAKLIWLEVFHCGEPFYWRKWVNVIKADSFQSVSPALSVMSEIVDEKSFNSLGLLVQSTAMGSCAFIEEIQKMKRARNDGLAGTNFHVIVDPSASNVTKIWIRRISAGKIENDVCEQFVKSLDLLRLSESNETNEKWKFEVLTSFAKGFCARKLPNLDIFWRYFDIEHSDHMICRQIVISLLESKLLSSEHYNYPILMQIGDFEVIMSGKLANFLCSTKLYYPMQNFVRRAMKSSATFEKKVRILDSVYNKLIFVGDVGVDDIEYFVMAGFKAALNSNYVSRDFRTAAQEMFHVSRIERDIFISEPRLLEFISSLVVDRYIEDVELATDAQCLLKLPLETSDKGTMLSLLTAKLSFSLQNVFNDIEEFADVYQLLFGEATTELCQILDTVLKNAINDWDPCGCIDIFKMKSSCIRLLEKFQSDHDNNGSIEFKFDALRQFFHCWTSNADIANLPLEDIKSVHSHYELSKWEAIESLIGKRIHDADSLVACLRQFDRITESIHSHLHLSEEGVASQSVVDTLRRYECNMNHQTSASRLLQMCKTVIDSSSSDVKEKLSISSIQELCLEISNFREEFDIQLQTAAYFLTVDSKLFAKSIGGTCGSLTIEDFLEKITESRKTLHSIFTCEGSAWLHAVIRTVEMFSDPNELNILHRGDLQDEVSVLLACPTFDVNEYQRNAFHIIASLVSVTKPLRAFVHCCKQLQFRFTSADKNFHELESLVNDLECRQNSELNCQQYLDLAKSFIQLCSNKKYEELDTELLLSTLDETATCMTIFETISNSGDVWIFVREMKWFGKDGLQQFYSEFSNTTNKLIFASYESTVLDSLEPTVRFISHVGSLHEGIDTKDFIQSMMQTFKYDIDSRHQREEILHIVQQNISSIRDWFDNGVDDMTAIFSRFDMVWRTGNYVIDEGNLCLLYVHDQKEVRTLGSKLDDFAQQLGFVQHENEEVSSQITSFLDQLQILGKVLSMQHHIISTGYLKDELDQFSYIVNQESSTAMELLWNSNQLLKDCESWEKQLRKKFPLSILLWNSELRELYDALFADEKEIHVILPILSTLVPPKILGSLDADMVLQITEDCLSLTTQNDPTWIESVSKFIELFDGKMKIERPSKKPSGRHGIVLHCLDCKNEDHGLMTLRVVSHVYKKALPQSFEIMDGFCSPSMVELNLFLDRVALFPGSTFMLMNVQALPGNYQEAIVNFTSRPNSASNPYNLHCVQLCDTILHSSPWVEEIIWDGETLGITAFDTWKPLLVDQVNIEGVQVVTSASCGAGKTKLIQKSIDKLKEKYPESDAFTVCIHEGTTLESLTRSLRKHQSHLACMKIVHFSFMLPLERCDENLIRSLNHFFNHLLLSRSVGSLTAGDTFIMGWSKWHIFVEIPGIGIKRRSLNTSTMAMLERYLPILSLCATIQVPAEDFDIDEKTLRVCTYLRAFSNGSIDRKFERNASKKLIFVIDDSGSMGLTLEDGQTPFEIAIKNALDIFDSHVQVGDSFGTIIFSNISRVQVQMQHVKDEYQKQRIRAELGRSSFVGGQTEMYLALNHSMNELQKADFVESYGQSWIVCLTDGESDASGYDILRQTLSNSSPKLHLMVVGVNLNPYYEDHLRELCSKFGRKDTSGAFIPSQANAEAMNKAFRKIAALIPVSETFELDGVLDEQDCRRLLKQYLPDTVQADDMLRTKFWVEFIFRRVKVFDENDDFNYNESHGSLGSSLMAVMLSEAQHLLSTGHCTNWKGSNHEQLIYDFSDPSTPQFRLICTAPDLMTPESIQRYESLDLPGFCIPTSTQLRQRSVLDRFLSQALTVPLVGPNESGSDRLYCIDENGFVLTLDFVMKLLNIHERVACRIPCIIEGETGVSKTALTKMYCILRNSSLNEKAKVETKNSLDTIVEDLKASNLVEPSIVTNSHSAIKKGLLAAANGSLSRKTIISCEVYRLLKDHCKNRSKVYQTLPGEFISENSLESHVVLKMLDWFAGSAQEQTFFELNVDASLSEGHIKAFFNGVSKTARRVSGSGALVVVFLDEINTSSVLGLLKEIIIDRSICGRLIEDNIVVVAACNPARGRPFSYYLSRECDLAKDWASGHYQVNELPLTLSNIKWQYGALNAEQEKEFVFRRMEMMKESIPKFLQAEFIEIVSTSQETMRSFAADELLRKMSSQNINTSIKDEDEAEIIARSTVSLRNIQRAFRFFQFFTTEFPLTMGEDNDHYRSSMYLTIAVVYYLGLTNIYRNLFVDRITKSANCRRDFLSTLDTNMTKIALETKIPDDIALTDGLKENIFITLVCALSFTPLVIVGPPGSSKTLSVNIVDDNTNGEESPTLLYRQLSRLSTFHYQCSKTSTSDEVSSVFERAIQRQNAVNPTEHRCLVIMDEAGLPEEEKESLKVLHYYLEGHMSTKAKVGFVAITNNVLDAAKMNRCVSLLRQDPSDKEMLQIAQGILYNGSHHDVTAINFSGERLFLQDFATKLCSSYKAIVSMSIREFKLETFYGLRDFIYFLKNIKGVLQQENDRHTINVTLHDIVRALERNFNGTQKVQFEKIVASFIASCSNNKTCDMTSLLRRPLEVVSEALSVGSTSKSRYTLIIDESTDDSMTRILKNEGLLDISKKTLFKLSNLGENSESERVSLTSGVKFAASQGLRIILSQTDAVNENFYDLFNQHFRCIRNQRDGNEYLYANIAVGGVSRRSMISSTFRCVLHVRAEDLPNMPAPFLNRFEKYRMSMKSVLSSKMEEFPFFKRVLARSKKQIDIFTSNLMLCGFAMDQTVESLFLDLISTPAETVSPASDKNNLKTFADYFIVFAGIHLKCNLSRNEFKSITDICLKFLPLSESEALSDLLKKTEVTCAKQLFHECLNGEPSNTVSVIIDRLSEIIITKQTIFKLLELASPEEIFAKRHILPMDIVSEYFKQQHFGMQQLLQRVGLTSRSGIEKCIVHTRSDVDIMRIPTVRESERNSINLEKVQHYVHVDPASVIIEHLELIKNESSLRNTIESWFTATNISVFLLIVNMSSQKAFERVNFVRCCIDQIQIPHGVNKTFMAVLHYTPSALLSIRSFYPALFLGGWRHIYLNSVCKNRSTTDLKHVIEKACIGFQDCTSLRIQEITNQIMTDVLNSLASHNIFYPDQISPVSSFEERHKLLLSMLDCSVRGKTIRSILSTKFCELWTESNLVMTLQRASLSLKRGTSQLGLTRCLHSIMKDAMRIFCHDFLIKLNEWKNFDLLLDSDRHGRNHMKSLFFSILDQIPGLPFDELVLHQVDPTRSLRELPLSLTVKPSFPFFSIINKLLDEIVECTLVEYDVRKDAMLSMEVQMVLNDAMALLSKNAVNEMYSKIALQTVETVLIQNSGNVGESLFQDYVDQFITCKLCCSRESLSSKWFIEKLHLEGDSTKNLLTIHIAARKYEMSLIRLSSMDDGLIWRQCQRTRNGMIIPESDLPLPALEVVGSMCSWFANNILQLANGNSKIWLDNFSIFFGILSDIIGDQKVICERTCALLRLIVFFYVLKRNFRDSSICFDYIHIFYDGKNVRNNIDTSMIHFIKLLQDNNEEDANKKRCIKALLLALFSPQILSTIDLHWKSDLDFLTTDLRLLEVENTNDLIVNLIRNACIYGIPRDTNATSSMYLSPTRLEVINHHLSCKGFTTSFSEVGYRLSIPRFVPKFALRTNQEEENIGILSVKEEMDGIEFFFSNSIMSFHKSSIADAAFQIMLENTIRNLAEHSSEQFLLLFLRLLEKERTLTRQEQTRLRRIRSNGEGDPFVGSPLGILILESTLVCFLFKISFEMAKGYPIAALEGIYGEHAWSVLNNAMATDGIRYQEIFMLNIIRLGGQNKLFELVRRDGYLSTLSWIKEWSGGLPEVRGETEDAMNKAEAEFQEALHEEHRKAREMRLCPHCMQPFQIFERNCGQFVCGRADTHTTPLNGPLGCGRTFTEHQARFYVPDQTLLNRLQQAVSNARQNVQAHNNMSMNWKQLETATLPCLSSKLDGDASASYYPVSIAVKSFGNDSDTIRHLIYSQGKIGSFLMLPDLIEFYLWLHSTFKFILSSDEATSLTFGEVMDENLLLKRFDQTHTDHLLSLYKRAKVGLSKHLENCNFEVNWDCEIVCVPIHDLDETPLMMLLSAYEHPADGYDYLFIIINQLILQFNEFIFKLFDHQEIAVSPKMLLHRSPNGLGLKSLNFLISDDFPLMVESYRTTGKDEYNVKALEDQLLEKLSVCNFSIDPPMKSLRSKFQFRTIDVLKVSSELTAGLKSSSGAYFAHQQDLQLFETCIECAKESLRSSREMESTFISNFHMLDYEELRSMLEGIRHTLQSHRSVIWKRYQEIFPNMSGNIKDMEEIGFPRLTSSQVSLLFSLQPSQISDLINFTGYQLASESYNFATLPLSMKSLLSDDLKKDFRKKVSSLVHEFGTKQTIHHLNEFKRDVLSFFQSVIRDQCSHSNDKMKYYLEKNNFCDGSDPIMNTLSDQITIRNFVSLYQEIHQLILLFISKDNALDLIEDDPIEVDSSYTNPRRGCCWFFNAKQDHEKTQPSSINENSGDEISEGGNSISLGINDEPEGLWFGSAMPTQEECDSSIDQLSKDCDINYKEDCVSSVDQSSDQDMAQNEPSSSDFAVSQCGGVEDVNKYQYEDFSKHFAANKIQIWWRLLKLHRLSRNETSNDYSPISTIKYSIDSSKRQEIENAHVGIGPEEKNHGITLSHLVVVVFMAHVLLRSLESFLF